MMGDASMTAVAMNIIAWVVATFLWEGVVIGMLGWLALRLARNLRPSIRYVLAGALLASLVVLPIVNAVRFAADSPSANTERIKERMAGEPSAVVNASIDETLPSTAEREARPGATAPEISRPRGVAAKWLDLQHRIATGITPFAGAIALFWLLGAIGVGGRALADLHAIRTLRQKPVGPLPPHLASRTVELRGRLGLTRDIVVGTSRHVEVPLVFGRSRPLVLIPERLVGTLAERDVEMFIAHELAHVARNDYAVNLVQVVVESLLFFHPVTWWLSARVREEREHCCDALALELTRDMDPAARYRYIAALVSAEEMRQLPTPRLASGTSRGSLRKRAQEVLEWGGHARAGLSVYAAMAVVTIVMAMLLIAPQPSLAALARNALPPLGEGSTRVGVSTADARAGETVIWRGVIAADQWLRVRNLVGAIDVGRATGSEVIVTTSDWRSGTSSPVNFETSRDASGITVCAIRPGVECDENGNILHIAPSELYSDSVSLRVLLPDGINLLLASSDGALSVAARPAAVQAQAGLGAITVVGARGSVEAATGGGMVRLNDVRGDATVRSSGGNVSLSGVTGDIEVRSSRGNVDASLRVSDAARRWSLQTSSGTIVVRGLVPRAASIEVAAPNGRVYSELPYRNTSRATHLASAEPAPGKSMLLASTSDGDVFIQGRR